MLRVESHFLHNLAGLFLLDYLIEMILNVYIYFITFDFILCITNISFFIFNRHALEKPANIK